MTIQQLIDILQATPAAWKNREIRLWLPGSQFTFEGTAIFTGPRSPDGKDSEQPVALIEGAMVQGSLLR